MRTADERNDGPLFEEGRLLSGDASSRSVNPGRGPAYGLEVSPIGLKRPGFDVEALGNPHAQLQPYGIPRTHWSSEQALDAAGRARFIPQTDPLSKMRGCPRDGRVRPKVAHGTRPSSGRCIPKASPARFSRRLDAVERRWFWRSPAASPRSNPGRRAGRSSLRSVVIRHLGSDRGAVHIPGVRLRGYRVLSTRGDGETGEWSPGADGGDARRTST